MGKSADSAMLVGHGKLEHTNEIYTVTPNISD